MVPGVVGVGSPSEVAPVRPGVRGPVLTGPVLIGTAGKVAEAATLVLLATVVPRVLGPAGYGRFSVALTIVTLGSLAMTLGGSTLLSRYVPAAPPADRAAVALALTVRLARNRALVFVAPVVASVVLAVVAPAAFPPLVVACVLLALGLNVAATLVLQADLGLGRPLGWCLRYPVQNAVLVAVVLPLHEDLGLTGGAVALLASAVAGVAVAAAASGPLRAAAGRRVAPPEGALRFGLLQAGGGALTQFVHRGGVLAVVLLTGSAVQTGFAALPIGIALAATYAVAQLFTVTLPVVTGHADGEQALRRLAGLLLVPVAAGAVGSALVVDTVVPVVFGAAYAGSAAAFLPAIAMVVLAPVNALAVQASALRLRPAAILYAGLAGAAVFVAVCLLAVPGWGAAGATTAALAGTAATAAASLLLLPGAVGARLALCTTAAVAAVLVLG
jgi:O-antigen/teichoic acid export membrane protein